MLPHIARHVDDMAFIHSLTSRTNTQGPGCIFMNACFTREGFPAAVLLRALAPLEGVELMRRRRARSNGRSADALSLSDLCRGPGNLSKALGITLRDNRRDMISGRLTIEDWGLKPDQSMWSPRIGIRVGVEKRWRCYEGDCQCVSGSVLRSDR